MNGGVPLRLRQELHARFLLPWHFTTPLPYSAHREGWSGRMVAGFSNDLEKYAGQGFRGRNIRAGSVLAIFLSSAPCDGWPARARPPGKTGDERLGNVPPYRKWAPGSWPSLENRFRLRPASESCGILQRKAGRYENVCNACDALHHLFSAPADKPATRCDIVLHGLRV